MLPIHLDDLLRLRVVESERVEFRATWDELTAAAALRTICAFANDVQNLNGGYLVLGVEEQGGVPILPPRGLPPEQLDAIQKELREQCHRLSPDYQPVLSPEIADGRHLLVVWAPGSNVRPHQAPQALEPESPLQYYVREGRETVIARKGALDALMHQSAKVPFDDRRALGVALEKVREPRLREFLADVRSGLASEPDGREILRRMFLSTRVNGEEVPRNVALLFFADEPEEWFRGARIEVVQFAGDAPGKVIAERVFRGPLHEQLRAAIRYLQSLLAQLLDRPSERPQVRRWESYPPAALEEALANALYHRSYEGATEPTRVHVHPDRIEITSASGPVPGITREHFRGGVHVPPCPARNRRIGELLKHLRLTEGRRTGVPRMMRAMRENGSAPAKLNFDDKRSFFRVVLPAHPEYAAIAALRDAAQLRAAGDEAGATRRLGLAFVASPRAAGLAVAVIEDRGRRGEIEGARDACDRFLASGTRLGLSAVVSAMARVYLDARRDPEAAALLDQLSPSLPASEAIEIAILERRAGRLQRAHQLFESAGRAVKADSRALIEHAQTKARLAAVVTPLEREPTPLDRDAPLRLLREAREMFCQVLQMDAPAGRHAWAWFELGRVLRWLGEPEAEIRQAFEKACELLPGESRFQEELSSSSAAPPRRG